MFPDLDKDIIDDVVRMKEGRYDSKFVPLCQVQHADGCRRVGLAVEACLALSS